MASNAPACYCSVQRRISRLIRRNYASSYLVCHYRFRCGLYRESVDAYASIDHMDSGAWHCRLDYRRGSNASVLSAKRWRPISSGWRNRFHSRSSLGALSLAQVSVANTARINSTEEFSRNSHCAKGRDDAFAPRPERCSIRCPQRIFVRSSEILRCGQRTLQPVHSCSFSNDSLSNGKSSHGRQIDLKRFASRLGSRLLAPCEP
jgi:hypothetical protein